MIDHAHSAIWAQKPMKQAPNSFVLSYFSKKNDFRASEPNLMGFFAQNNQKGLSFHIQLEEIVNEICKVQTSDLKTAVRFDRPNSCSGSKKVPYARI